ncbi:MAG: BMP family lipoprotein [Gaiellaceae bacterium]
MSRKITLAIAGVLIATLVIAATAASGGTKAHKARTAQNASFIAALVSDVGKFNDRSFNQGQLAGLKRAKAKLGVQILPIQSNSSSDYLPNLTTAVRRKAKIVMAAGYLLAPTVSEVAPQFPQTDFTITDDSVKGPDFKKAKSIKNIEGLVYASNQSGCLVGYLAGEMVKKHGGKQVIGAVGGIKIPAVDDYIVGYKYCAKLADPKIKVLVGYSQDFVAQDKCKTVAQNQIGQGSQVEFQVAGLCGLGALSAADDAKIWGIGVDVDQYKLAKRVLTSALKRIDVGIYTAVKQAKSGKFNGGHDLLFSLKNNGVGIGKINPSVPKSFVAKMNALKAKIISGKVKVPVAPGSPLTGLLK